MSVAIGIDLGTTNSVGAFKFARLEVVTAADNPPPERVLTRSAVAYAPEGPCVGQEATAQLVAAPERVVVSVKRIMGRGHADPAVQEYLKRFGQLAVEAPDGGTDQGLAIRMGSQRLAPEDVSAAILSKVVANAQAYLAGIGRPGVRLDRAVITVPAYFNDKQRHATRVAGTRAGFADVELLPEPTAAAISYAHDAGDAQTILVYDFGGGTFDASLITAADNTFIESAKAGDLWLGGNDVDLALEAHVLEVVGKEEGIADVPGLVARLSEGHRRRFTADLRQAVEQAKIALSRVERTIVSPATPLLDARGMQIMIEVPLTRADLEQRIASMVDRTLDICRGMIEDAGFPLDAIERVLLVGGSSQIPLVQQRVRAAFGDRVVVHPRPMTAVAEGAAIVAAGLVEKVGTVSRDYFIRLATDPRHRVIGRNEVLPVRSSQTFVTVEDGQRLLRLRFYNHDHVAGIDEPIGDMWLGLGEDHPKGTELLTLLELDESCNVLQITASLKLHPEVRLSRSFSRGQADEALFQQLEGLLGGIGSGHLSEVGRRRGLALAVEAVHLINKVLDERTGQVREEAVQEARAKLDELKDFLSPEVGEAKVVLAELQSLLELAGEFMTGSERQAFERLIARLEAAFAAGDEPARRSAVAEAKRLLDNLSPVPGAVRTGHLCLRRVSRGRPGDFQMAVGLFEAMLAALRNNDYAAADRELDRLRDLALDTGPDDGGHGPEGPPTTTPDKPQTLPGVKLTP
jgi:molecular chaperone DnaK